MKAPDSTMPTITTAWWSAKTAIITRSSMNSTSVPITAGMVPTQRWTRGATNTDVRATSTPQPK